VTYPVPLSDGNSLRAKELYERKRFIANIKFRVNLTIMPRWHHINLALAAIAFRETRLVFGKFPKFKILEIFPKYFRKIGNLWKFIFFVRKQDRDEGDRPFNDLNH